MPRGASCGVMPATRAGAPRALVVRDDIGDGAHELELVSATAPAGDLAFAGGRIAAMAVESVHEEEVPGRAWRPRAPTG